MCHVKEGPIYTTYKRKQLMIVFFLQAFIESECNYRGNSLNSYSNVGSAEKCQEICKQSSNCDYFIFNLANQVWPLTKANHVGFFIYAIYFF